MGQIGDLSRMLSRVGQSNFNNLRCPVSRCLSRGTGGTKWGFCPGGAGQQNQGFPGTAFRPFAVTVHVSRMRST